MNRLLTSILFLSFSICVFCQEEYNTYTFIRKHNKKEECYIKKAKVLIKRDLTKEHIYNSSTVRSLVNNVEYLLIPMYKMNWVDSLDYSNEFNFLGSLELNNKTPFHEVIMFKEGGFYGVFNCNELGSCGVSLYKDTPNSFNDLINDLNQLALIEYDQIFYVHGILHAWWVIKDAEILVYSLLNREVYTPQEFIIENYTNDKIRERIQYYL